MMKKLLLSIALLCTSLSSAAQNYPTFQYVTGKIQMGSGVTGLLIEPLITGGYGAIYSTNVTPNSTNWSFVTNSTNTEINGVSSTNLNVGGAIVASASSGGLAVTGILSSTSHADVSKNIFLSSTAPTLASGGCSTATITQATNTGYFTATNSGTCTGSQPLVFTLPAAAHSWHCTARDVTTPANVQQTGAISTTSVTITNYSLTTGLAQAWTTGDVVEVSCMGG